MRFAKWVFLVAGVFGVLAVAPIYFLEERLGADYPPAINHPEFFYGFAGVALSCQFLFLVIASDPVRFRRAMLPAVLEKASFAGAIAILYAQQRVDPVWLGFAAIDGTLGILFVAAYLRTPSDGKPS